MENRSAGRHDLMFPCATEMLLLLVAKRADDVANGFSNAMAIELSLTARQCKRRMSMGEILINDESIAC